LLAVDLLHLLLWKRSCNQYGVRVVGVHRTSADHQEEINKHAINSGRVLQLVFCSFADLCRLPVELKNTENATLVSY